MQTIQGELGDQIRDRVADAQESDSGLLARFIGSTNFLLKLLRVKTRCSKAKLIEPSPVQQFKGVTDRIYESRLGGLSYGIMLD